MVQFDDKALAKICEQHDVIRLRIFGSAARGEERPDSDIDVIVDFGNPKGLFSLLRLERSLSEFFGQSVDLVTEPGLSPYIRESVVSSASIIFDAAA
jgi:predicted nucleotidyltransferase